MRRLRICLIASSRFPVAEPFAGGLEAHTHSLAKALQERGHEVSLFAAPGSDPRLLAEALVVDRFRSSDAARDDVAAPPEQWMSEHHAYLALMLELGRSAHHRFDVVHNNSLHHLPVAMASALPIPVATTLHTPPTPWLESAIRLAPDSAHFVAVSRCTAEQWSGVAAPRVIMNGVDTAQWKAGPGGSGAIWFGRLVPEKAPHLAIEAARIAGLPLDLAGPAYDSEYFERMIAPWLDDRIRYLGHLSSAELVQHVGRSAVSVVTPRWEEPYGLVAAESMACGTPVAAFSRGALPEFVTRSSGRLAPADDVEGLAEAMLQASALSREETRRHAERMCSLETMVDRYEDLYDELATGVRAA